MKRCYFGGNICEFQTVLLKRLLSGGGSAFKSELTNGEILTTIKFKRRQRSTLAQPEPSHQPQQQDRQINTSVNKDEIEKFERMSSSWWNQTDGEMKELHSMNRLRVPLIRDGLLQRVGKPTKSVTLRPLEGFKILDVGCGGGILCEPLGRLGADVTGIDPGSENIAVAQTHLATDLMENVSYECSSIEDFVTRDNIENFDAVVMSEVIEHVDNPEQFISCAVEVLKPGGSFFLTTINRTTESWLGAIIAWEYILRNLPVGTHNWNKFLTPLEVDRLLRSIGLRTILIHGMCYNPINNSWKWSNQQGINYALHAVKD